MDCWEIISGWYLDGKSFRLWALMLEILEAYGIRT